MRLSLAEAARLTRQHIRQGEWAAARKVWRSLPEDTVIPMLPDDTMSIEVAIQTYEARLDADAALDTFRRTL